MDTLEYGINNTLAPQLPRLPEKMMPESEDQSGGQAHGEEALQGILILNPRLLPTNNSHPTPAAQTLSALHLH